jgi:hypothetical protein
MSGNNMIPPGEHESAAHNAAMAGDIAGAQIYAILALASAVNRLADAHEAMAGQ